MEEKAKKILLGLQTQCAKREYCSRDIFRKALLKLDGDEAAAREILSSLVSDRFVDDLRYASAFCREKSSINGWGPVRLRRELSARSIDGEVIGEALSQIDREKADERLLKLLQAKWKTLKGDPQARLKLLRFALSRGYEYSTVEACLPEVLSRPDDC